MRNLERYFPLGFPGVRAVRWLLAGLGGAALWFFFTFVNGYVATWRSLFDVVHGERILLPGAVVRPFPELMERAPAGLLLLAVCLVGLAGLHYGWHRMGSRSIYRMRLLPSPWELRRRCLTAPALGLAACALVWLILALVCALCYYYLTPAGHLPPEPWGGWPLEWIGGSGHA